MSAEHESTLTEEEIKALRKIINSGGPIDTSAKKDAADHPPTTKADKPDDTNHSKKQPTGSHDDHKSETAAHDSHHKVSAHSDPHHHTKKGFLSNLKEKASNLIQSARPFVEKLTEAIAWAGTGATALAYKAIPSSGYFFNPAITFPQLALWTIAAWGIHRLVAGRPAAGGGHGGGHGSGH